MTIRLQVDRLDWDAWNLEHIKKHDVTKVEAEEVVLSYTLTEETYKGRYRFIGETASGQVLRVIAGENPRQRGLLYVFSAHPASRKERSRYQAFRESESSE